MLVFFFAGCEKEIEPNPNFFIGEWTTFIPNNEQKTDILNVCFKINDVNDIEYYDYSLTDFKFDKNELKISFEIHTDLFSTIRYFGFYDIEKDAFVGQSCYYNFVLDDNIEHCVYFHKNVMTIRK